MPDPVESVTLELTTMQEDGATLLAVVHATETPDSAAVDPVSTGSTEAVGELPDRLELVAAQEIVLRCGRASITLTRSGKIILRGTHVVSRSSGLNAVRGASVQIN